MEFVLDLGMRAVVCVPLLTRTGQFVGTLSTLFAVPHVPSERQLRLLDLLARQAADFIERTKAEESLRAARQELADANADLGRKVEERTAKLREAMVELEHMSYSMVHDMRAPLRAIQSFAEMMQEQCAGRWTPQTWTTSAEFANRPIASTASLPMLSTTIESSAKTSR
jgi:GAF domain-containing protein